MLALGAAITGFIQVFLVSIQTRQVSHRAPLAHIFLVSCAISTVWIMNVRVVDRGTIPAIAYVLGAASGTVAAMKVKMKVRG